MEDASARILPKRMRHRAAPFWKTMRGGAGAEEGLNEEGISSQLGGGLEDDVAITGVEEGINEEGIDSQGSFRARWRRGTLGGG